MCMCVCVFVCPPGTPIVWHRLEDVRGRADGTAQAESAS